MADLARIAVAEDGRGVRDRVNSLAILTTALRHHSPVVRASAVRGLGRWQDSSLVGRIAGLFGDPDALVRVEAINAWTQAHQGLRSAQPAVRRVAATRALEWLSDRARSDTSSDVLGIVVRSIGRLPHADTLQARAAELAILDVLGRVSAANRPALAEGAQHGLYALARLRRSHGALSSSATKVIGQLGLAYSARQGETGARVVRLALLSLTANGTPDSALLVRSLGHGDEQVRRLAVAAHSGVSASLRSRLLDTAVTDRSWLVRLERVRGWRMLGAAGCGPLVRAVSDPSPHVMLAAVDGLSGCASDPASIAALERLAAGVSEVWPTRPKGSVGWRAAARALVSLARAAPARARPIASTAAASRVWSVRQYAARAAAAMSDTGLLRQLAADTNGNVQEAAIAGLRQAGGQSARDVFVRGLESQYYHVVLAAATALRGAQSGADLIAPLMRSLERLTREERENSRDPRVAILDRIDEFSAGGVPVPQLEPWLTDFDSTVAARAAATITRRTGRNATPAPSPKRPPDEPVAEVLSSNIELVFIMADGSGGTVGGNSFTVRLNPRAAPMTAARLVRLARAGYYNGLTFHRVEPGFVIQGGSPAATEYVGDGPFMRDELGLDSHVRGTVGISTRGRDTGDAQIFVNLVDNFRLDHDYTVLGAIVSGRDVAEGVLEADVIERVEVRRVR
ncbi:MAG: peptidylprolyl isomerase [Gemmatimonadota bacterium]